jgi:hypothetical protein
MDLHLYDIVHHDTTHHDNYHVHIHGLIHDNRLRAYQSCLLGLMYILKVNVCS